MPCPSTHPSVVDDRPTAYEPPRQHSTVGRNGAGLDYELGGPPSSAPPSDNIYGSVVDQVLYVPDASDDPGVDRISTYDWSNHTIVEHPEPVWWGVGKPKGRNTDPSVDVTFKDSPAATWATALGRPVNQPFLVARSTQTWSNDAIIVFKPGFLGTTGTQTSSDTHPFFQFPANKVPMAIAITSENELTLVAIWDTETQKGQIAVLANLALGLAPYHTWPYFGLPNGGSYTAFKLLGYVDLPFSTPTAISAVGNADTNPPGAQQGKWISLDTQAVRDAARTSHDVTVSSAGYALVASRWENKVAFVDLQPLFAFLRDRYLTTQANYDEASTTDPAVWPYSFDTHPEMVPLVVAAIDAQGPTVVLAGKRRYTDDVRAHVATYDGTITTYDLTSLGGVADFKPGDVKVLATIQVGANPTAMAWPRNEDPLEKSSSPYSFNEDFAVVSRAEREIAWVATTKTNSTIFRRFRDTRMGDPVDIDVGERAYVMTVADWKGKKVINYRFAPTPADHISPAQAFGMGADGIADAECGGELTVMGAAFKVSSTNVN